MLIPVRIKSKTPEAEGIASFELVRGDGAPLPVFTAGAHIDVHPPGGPIRQYSLCNPPGETHRYQIGILQEPNGRGGSLCMHGLSAGDTLLISEPRNLFPLHPAAKRSLLMAGGIGVTPLLAMAEHLGAQGADFEFHYCVRSEARLAFRHRIETSRFAAQLRLHVADGPQSQQLNCNELLSRPGTDDHLYVCGPAGFMNHVLDSAKASGWAESNLHREFFSAEPVDRSSDGSFEIQLKSGRVIRVAAGQTAAQALEAGGIHVPLSCEQGVCGTCLTPVLDGVPEHRDMFLSDEEHAANDCFTPCCSRAKTARLVLGLE